MQGNKSFIKRFSLVEFSDHDERGSIIDELTFYGFGFALWNDSTGEIENVLPARKSEFIFKPGVDRLKENIRIFSCIQ